MRRGPVAEQLQLDLHRRDLVRCAQLLLSRPRSYRRGAPEGLQLNIRRRWTVTTYDLLATFPG
jgi:hypothetical protein